MGIKGPCVIPARIRLQGTFVWEMLDFIVNTSLFVLVGLQLRSVVERLGAYPPGKLALYAAMASLAVILTRIAWFFTTPYLIRGWTAAPASLAKSRAASAADPRLGAPGTDASGLIKALHVERDGSEESEEIRARLVATKAALAQLDELEAEEWTRDDTIERMRGAYNYRKRRFAARAGKIEDDGDEDRSLAYQQIGRLVLAAQREALVRARKDGEISNEVMNAVIQDLDLEETRLEI